MNGPFPARQIEEAAPLAFFESAPAATRKPFDRSRLVTGGLAVAVHVLLFLVIAFSTGMTKAIVAPEPVLETEIIPAPQQKMELPPEPPQLTRAPTPDVPVPLVNIETPPAPGAIKVAAATPAPTAPSLPLQGTAETRQSYYARLLAQLNRVKRYPAAARTAHVEGVVMLHFVMNADGRVLSFEIATSSGKPLLDAEALALIARAQPLPPIPPDWNKPQLDITVPIEFSLH